MLPRITLFLAVLAFGSRAYCSALVPISRSAITQAISRGVNAASSPAIAISEDDVQLSIIPLARTPDPALALVSVRNTSDRGACWVRLRCHPAADCISFLVRLRPAAPSCESVRQILARKPATRNSLPLVPAGTRMHMVCRRGSVLISVQVRSLRAAHLGDEVRVYDDQSRRTYLGRLSAPGLVEVSY
jgi:Chaperone for flagella basal body P-ring formation